jgi:hypothetical protein
MEAHRGLVTVTGQEGIAEDMLRTGLKRALDKRVLARARD